MHFVVLRHPNGTTYSQHKPIHHSVGASTVITQTLKYTQGGAEHSLL